MVFEKMLLYFVIVQIPVIAWQSTRTTKSFLEWESKITFYLDFYDISIIMTSIIKFNIL